jgi:glycosyltransferase involved in cell wall biosynthesis
MQVYLRQPFDVIQACNPPDTYFALAAAFKPLGVRFVYDQHDLCPEVYECRFDRPRKVLLRALLALERATYHVADAVVSTNQSYREIAIRRGELDGERVSVVRTGPDPERLRPVTPEPELRHGRPHLCCYLGVMGPQDGVDVLVRVVAAVVHRLRRTDCHFALLGFGDSLDELKALARELEVEDWITFTGRADDSMIRAYLSTADVGVSPDPKTPFNDLSTHNKTMEYMAMGLPVVTFDLKETRVSAGDAAVYVDAGSDAVLAFAYALVCLVDSPRKRAQLSGVGRERVERELAWAHQAPGYVEVFERLIGS